MFRQLEGPRGVPSRYDGSESGTSIVCAVTVSLGVVSGDQLLLRWTISVNEAFFGAVGQL